jgi:hypothetical protein
MSVDQPLALKLAEDAHWYADDASGEFLNECAAELRRLQAENEALRTALKAVMALPAMNNSGDGTMEFYHAVRAADALARAGGKT